MKLHGWQYEKIKTTVADLFETISIDHFPVVGFEVAHKLGIRLMPYSAFDNDLKALALLTSDDAFSTRNPQGQWVICYNDEINSYGRQNFSIMHEIGHIVMQRNFCEDEDEAFADFFACYALAGSPALHLFQPKQAEDIEHLCSISHEMACNAFIRYQKWLSHVRWHNNGLTEPERKLMTLFAKTA